MRAAPIKQAILLTLTIACVTLVDVAGAATANLFKARDHGHLGVYKESFASDIQMGSYWADRDEYEKAIPYFKNAVEKNPTNVIAQYSLGYCLMLAAVETVDPYEKVGMLDESEWAFQRARDLNPELTLTYYKLGKLALIRNDFKAASNYYAQGVENNPENVGLMFNLAATYEKLNDMDKAVETYMAVIRVQPRFVYAHNNLGLIYEQNNEQDKAETVYREALKQVPDYNYARLNLGSMLQSQGRLDEALEVYRDAIHYEPDNAWAHLYLGNTYYRQGNYEAALQCYNQAIYLNPEYPTTYYLASLALHKLNRPEEALANGLQYINLAPNGAFSQEAGDLVLTLQQAKNRATKKD